MYTASIKEKAFELGELWVTVEYTNGTTTFTDPAIRIYSEQDLINKVRDRINQIETLETVYDSLELGNFTIPDQTKPAPTAEEIERDTWLSSWTDYSGAVRGMKALADAGIEPTAEETNRFNALKNWVATNRRPEYSRYL